MVEAVAVGTPLASLRSVARCVFVRATTRQARSCELAIGYSDAAASGRGVTVQAAASVEKLEGRPRHHRPGAAGRGGNGRGRRRRTPPRLIERAPRDQREPSVSWPARRGSRWRIGTRKPGAGRPPDRPVCRFRNSSEKEVRAAGPEHRDEVRNLRPAITLGMSPIGH